MDILIIDRSKWRTGGSGVNRTGIGDTSLCNNQGFQCCLGFESIRLGQTEKEIKYVSMPSDCYWEDNNHLVFCAEGIEPFRDNTQFSADAASINDDPETSPEEKEKRIKALFLTQNIEVQFIGEYVRP